MHSDLDLTEIVLKHNVPTWSLRDHVRKSSSRFDAWLSLSSCGICTPNVPDHSFQLGTTSSFTFKSTRSWSHLMVKWGARTCLRMSSTRMSKLRNPKSWRQCLIHYSSWSQSCIVNKSYSHSRDRSIWPISCWNIALEVLKMHLMCSFWEFVNYHVGT